MLRDPLVLRRGRRAEEGDPPAADVGERPRAQDSADDRDARPRQLGRAAAASAA